MTRIRTALIFSLLTALLPLNTAHADLKDFAYRRLQNGHHKSTTGLRVVLSDQWFDQRVDHITASDTSTFKQRYFVNTAFTNGSNTPVLYYICGEATCEGAGGFPPLREMARDLGATIVALEHRYYGYSQPFADLSPHSLKFLTTPQALEDLADFQKFAMSSLGLNGKWIAIGGSYAGSLSAYYRLKHPELVVGSWASSAPVRAKADFEEYDRHVARVAGPDCLSKMQVATAEVERRLKAGGATRDAVKAQFGSQDVIDDVDFLYVIADMSAAAIQYGFQKAFCNAITQPGDVDALLVNYAKIGTMVFAQLGITPYQDSFGAATSENPADYIDGFGMRSWMYQSCTEFGYYQVAYHDVAESSRSPQISQAYHDQVCKRLFGLDTPVNTDTVNTGLYQPLYLSGIDHIFMPNGANDPWSNLSILPGSAEATKNPALSTFLIANGAHCSDFGGGSNPSVGEALVVVNGLVREWLR